LKRPLDGRPGPLLVVAHEATRTGAPRVLLELLGGLKERWAVPMAVRLESGGPLAGDLLALADGPVTAGPSVVLVNSALAAGVDRPTGVPSALYVHEDRQALDLLPLPDRRAMAAYDRVMCVSSAVAADVVGAGVDHSRVCVVPPLVVPQVQPDDRACLVARWEVGAAPGEAIVLGCGEGEWRKGPDLFVAMAHRLAASPGLRFAWAGRRPLPFADLLAHDVAALGLGDRFTWLGEVARPGPYLAAADVVVVTSRYDPQPLVPIEAALLGTPSIGFAVGGMTDMAGSGAALTAPYPDVVSLADIVLRVISSRELRADLVLQAVRRWRVRQSPQVVVPRFARVLADLCLATVPVPGEGARTWA
jgi:glycosyltransferase involved in cell wall biosynthesis